MANTPVDTFDRADTAAGGVGNGWTDLQNAYSISSNRLHTGNEGQFLIRTGDTFLTGKRRILVHRADNGGGINMFIRGRKRFQGL